MKFTKIAAAAATVLILPALFCSCSTSGKEPPKEETAVSKQETPVQEEPQVVEVKADAKTEAALASQEAKKQEAKKAEESVPAVKPEKSAPAPEGKAEKKAVPPCQHTVRTGDHLWKIARRYYGTGSRWRRIYEANQDKIRKPDFLEPGTVLTIPAAE